MFSYIFVSHAVRFLLSPLFGVTETDEVEIGWNQITDDFEVNWVFDFVPFGQFQSPPPQVSYKHENAISMFGPRFWNFEIRNLKIIVVFLYICIFCRLKIFSMSTVMSGG